ncbi:MAG: M14 family metallopeptidase [Acidobacteriota bacterium]
MQTSAHPHKSGDVSARPPAILLAIAALLGALAAPAAAETREAEAQESEARESGSSAAGDGAWLEAARTPALPPALPWDGASRALALPPDSDDPWITPAEKSGLVETPRYAETVAYLERLCAASDALRLVRFGTSAEGRELVMVLASRDPRFGPETARTSAKPVVLAQAGIHSGEIDGKDAGLMLLRDMTVGGRLPRLLDGVHLLFVPVLNADGHERASAFSRLNQRGPREMGWRTTARNLNLNRDYAKAETPEMQAMIRVLETYRPDLYLDLHVTDGIDYQYDITWGYAGRQTAAASVAEWFETVLDPAVSRGLERAGHVPGYLVFATDSQKPESGLFKWSASSPRYSDGYGALRHLPTILVENHSLKPYDQRVLGTYVFLEHVLRTVAAESESLRRATLADRQSRPDPVVLSYAVDPDREPERVEFAGVAFEHEISEITGAPQVRWLGTPQQQTLPRIEATRPALVAPRPAAYWIPAPWREVIDRLALHGVQMEILSEPRVATVDLYRVEDAGVAGSPFEGRARVEIETPPTLERRKKVTYAAGSARVPTDQPLGTLAAVLLEPQSPDSFFQWGFFLEILSRTEYAEAYVLEPMARRMLEESPELRAEWQRALESDAELASSPRERLQWFYRRTPFFDPAWRLYPVGREPARSPEKGAGSPGS